jgi:hypothetical protein
MIGGVRHDPDLSVVSRPSTAFLSAHSELRSTPIP